MRRILSWIRDAAPAEPWLPTVAEQDAAWDAAYGDAALDRANAASFARGFQVNGGTPRTRDQSLAALAGPE